MAPMKSTNRGPIWAWLTLTLFGLFFAVPMIAMARFAFQRIPVALLGRHTILRKWTVDGLTEMFRDPDFKTALITSLKLGLLTVVLTLVLMVPTILWVNLVAPRLRNAVEIATMLPYVVPPIALVVGAGGAFRDFAPWFLRSDYCLVPFYTILAMPFTYRALDTGLRSIDLRTLLDASRSLGASPPRAIYEAVLPNMRSSLIGAGFLTVTVVLGEFTIAALLLKPTLPLYMAQSQGRNPQGALGLGIVMLVLTAGLFFVSTRLQRRRNPLQKINPTGVIP
jgi:putative spermidine/putrescine transport system permease protein